MLHRGVLYGLVHVEKAAMLVQTGFIYSIRSFQEMPFAIFSIFEIYVNSLIRRNIVSYRY
jgi:hypothetical protein